MRKITIDPVTRIEGHLKVEVTLENNKVTEANTSGTLFRGFENIFKGRDPRDALRLSQRICGVCPTIHAYCASLNLDNAFGIENKIPDNGRILRKLIQGANYLQSHILHFYHLTALDYVDLTNVADYQGKDKNLKSIKEFIDRGQLEPFVPRYEGDYRLGKEIDCLAASHYVDALQMRRITHEMLAIFGGKMPHNMAIVAGGVTSQVSVDKITNFLWRLNEVSEFIDNVYLEDVKAIAKAYPDHFQIGVGCGNLLSYGMFDGLFTRGRLAKGSQKSEDIDPAKITESVRSSWYNQEDDGLNPAEGQTQPDIDKKGAYSWIKSPRYDGIVHEVGPLARMLITYFSSSESADKVRKLVDPVLKETGLSIGQLYSCLGRHLMRALEAKLVADEMKQWLLELKPGQPTYVDYTLPEEATGVGMAEAPRGSLGHWIKIKNGRIDNYQIISPTTWNASPKDSQLQPGPMEQALMGTEVKDEENPFEVVRIIRSFDPCLACSVHMLTAAGKKIEAIPVV